jgi:hypothetical protein
MQLVSCQNSSEVNENHLNNILTVATSMMMSSRRCYSDVVTFILKWASRSPLSSVLISCRNSSGINGNHQNNMLTVATGNDDVILPVATVVNFYAITDLVPHRSLKLGLTNLKIKAC